jgi:hypothetical protein
LCFVTSRNDDGNRRIPGCHTIAISALHAGLSFLGSRRRIAPEGSNLSQQLTPAWFVVGTARIRIIQPAQWGRDDAASSSSNVAGKLINHQATVRRKFKMLFPNMPSQELQKILTCWKRYDTAFIPKPTHQIIFQVGISDPWRQPRIGDGAMAR